MPGGMTLSEFLLRLTGRRMHLAHMPCSTGRLNLASASDARLHPDPSEEITQCEIWPVREAHDFSNFETRERIA